MPGRQSPLPPAPTTVGPRAGWGEEEAGEPPNKANKQSERLAGCGLFAAPAPKAPQLTMEINGKPISSKPCELLVVPLKRTPLLLHLAHSHLLGVIWGHETPWKIV